MSFLAKLGSAGSRFLGVAAKGGRFLASNAGNIQKGARAISNAASDQNVQRFATSVIGVKPKVFQQVASVTGQVANNLPGVATATNTALTTTRRSLGDLYNAATRR